eukprot:scaffold168822_cov24-Tisochrysis_lutea.AAC.2
MATVQLGMRYSITRVTPEPGFKQLDSYDFQQKAQCARFRFIHSQVTALHNIRLYTALHNV